MSQDKNQNQAQDRAQNRALAGALESAVQQVRSQDPHHMQAGVMPAWFAQILTVAAQQFGPALAKAAIQLLQQFAHTNTNTATNDQAE